jgi:hypothetical protein
MELEGGMLGACFLNKRGNSQEISPHLAIGRPVGEMDRQMGGAIVGQYIGGFYVSRFSHVPSVLSKTW